MATPAHSMVDLMATSIAFGPFRLFPMQRLLTEAGTPVHLGSRAFDILVALLERPGELMSKEELMAKVWPNTFVAPTNIPVHILALRRALGDGLRGSRYVVNIPGRGYSFVAAVTVEKDLRSQAARGAPARERNLTDHSLSAVGRAETVHEQAEKLHQRRSLTILGRNGGVARHRAAISEVLRVIASSPHDLQPIFDTIIGSATLLCRANLGTVRLGEEKGFRLVAQKAHPNNLFELLSPPMPLASRTAAICTRLTAGLPVHIPDLQGLDYDLPREPALMHAVKSIGLRTYLAVPMIAVEGVTGLINIGRTRVQPFTDKEIELMMDFAAQAAIALEITRLRAGERPSGGRCANEGRPSSRTGSFDESGESLRAPPRNGEGVAARSAATGGVRAG
jgi:DNA-binding winged helix-turn-helix (wHTH) protein